MDKAGAAVIGTMISMARTERLVQSRMSKPVVLIENWAVVQDLVSESYRELEPGRHLTGYAFGHEIVPNSKFIYTSRIIDIDQNKGLVETLNTTYQLGEVNAEYKRWDWKRRAAA